MGVSAHSRPRVWKRLRRVEFSCLITLGGVAIMLFGTLLKSMIELGLGDFPGIVQAHVSRFARLLISL